METIKSTTGYTAKQIKAMSAIRFQEIYNQLEDENQHGACAIMTVCRAGKEKNAQALVLLQQIHDIVGFMSGSMMNLRKELATDNAFTF